MGHDFLGQIKIQICENPSVWNEKLSGAPGGWVSHTLQWRDSLESSFPHIKCFPLLIESDDSHITQIPLYRISSIITGTRYVSVPFSSISSILCDSMEHITALVNYLQKIQAKKKNCDQVELHSNTPHDLFERSGHFQNSRNYLHHFLDLRKDIDTIFNSFNESDVRLKIKKSEKKDLVFRRADRASDVHDFYRLYCLTRQRRGLPPMPLIFLQRLFSNFFNRRELEIYFADHAGKAVAGLLLLKYRDTVLAEFAGDDFLHRNLFPNQFIYWNCIKMAHKEGFKTFSFGRTHHLNTGLLQFKRRWGTREEWMADYRYPKESASNNTKENTFTYRFIRNVSPRLPMPLFKTMGNIIYRHLG